MLRKKILKLIENSFLLENSLKDEVDGLVNILNFRQQKELYDVLLLEYIETSRFIFDKIKTKEDALKFNEAILKVKRDLYKKEEDQEKGVRPEDVLDVL